MCSYYFPTCSPAQFHFNSFFCVLSVRTICTFKPACMLSGVLKSKYKYILTAFVSFETTESETVTAED